MKESMTWENKSTRDGDYHSVWATVLLSSSWDMFSIRPPEFCTHVLPPNFSPKFGGVYQASLASYRTGRLVYLAILPGSCWEKGNAEATLKGRVEAKNHADVIRMYLQMVRLPSYYVTICMATIHPLFPSIISRYSSICHSILSWGFPQIQADHDPHWVDVRNWNLWWRRCTILGNLQLVS
jgi:hypothetical protein